MTVSSMLSVVFIPKPSSLDMDIWLAGREGGPRKRKPAFASAPSALSVASAPSASSVALDNVPRRARSHLCHQPALSSAVAGGAGAACASPAPLSPTLLTVLTIFSSVLRILIMLLPANPRYRLPNEFLTIKNLIGAPGPSRSRRPWWKNLIDQAIIRSLEWVDESDALQDEPILQIFSQQAPHTGTLCRRPQHRVPERQSVSS